MTMPLNTGQIALLSSFGAILLTKTFDLALAWYKQRRDAEHEDETQDQQLLIAREANETRREEMLWQEINNLRDTMLQERKECREETERLERVNGNQQEQIDKLRQRIWDLEHLNGVKPSESP